MIKRHKTRRNKTRRNKTRRNKTRRNKTRRKGGAARREPLHHRVAAVLRRGAEDLWEIGRVAAKILCGVLMILLVVAACAGVGALLASGFSMGIPVEQGAAGAAVACVNGLMVTLAFLVATG